MKARTKAMLAYLILMLLVDTIEVSVGWMPSHDMLIQQITAWLCLPLWELYIAKGVSND